MFALREIFFQPLKCQPNINTLRVHRNSISGNQQLYLIGLDGSGVIVEYLKSTNEYKAYPIASTDAPSECRVLCMEILPISKLNTTPAIIYGYAKTAGITNSDSDTSFCFDRLQIVDNSMKATIPLRTLHFAPKFMKVLVLKNLNTNENESILIVGGAEKLLFFNEKNERLLQDITKSIDQHLPELKQTSGNVTALDYLVITDPTTNQIKQRLIIVGHANGLIDFHVTEIQSDGTWKTTSTTLEYDSFISSVKFFYHNHKPKPDEQPLLLITGALEPAVIYRNLLTHRLNDPVVLPGTDSQDCLTCSAIADIDLDGKNEILLGTFGKVCFICRVPIENSKPNSSDAASAFGVVATDLTQDGLDEIIIATTRGLHIYQLDLIEVTKLLETRLEKKRNEIHTIKSQ